jgi:hypothetical protein
MYEPIMQINKIPRPPVGANTAMGRPTPAPCRGRFIVPTAALSALCEYQDIPIISSMFIIVPTADVPAFFGVSDIPIISVKFIKTPE